MTASWWIKEKEQSYDQLLLNHDTDSDDDDDDLLVGQLVLIPPSRQICAYCHWQQIPDLDETSTHCLGGLALYLGEACRKNHPVSGTSNRYRVALGVGCASLVAAIVLLSLAVKKTLPELFESSAWFLIHFTVNVAAVLFVLMPVSDWAHQQSEMHQTALNKFHLETEELVAEWKDKLHPHGFLLSSSILEEGRSGRVIVRLEKNHEMQPLSLPDVTTESVMPVNEMPADLALLGCLPMSLPLDKWTYGGLMVIVYRSHKQLLAQSHRSCIMKSLLVLDLLVFGGIVMALDLLTGVDSTIIFLVVMLFWFPITAVLFLLESRYIDERLYSKEKHEFFRRAVNQVSVLSEQRHGLTLEYEVLPGWLPNTTKGMIRFVQTTTTV